MRTYDDYNSTATDGAPFLNSAEWAIWHFSVCLGGEVSGRRCVLAEAVNDGCPLLRLSRQQKTPAEWVGSKGTVIFRCTEKTTPVELRVAAAAEEKARIEAEHYPMFGPEVS